MELQFTIARVHAVAVTVVVAALMIKYGHDYFWLPWASAVGAAVILNLPVVLIVLLGGTPGDVLRVLLVLAPPILVGLVNPCGGIIAIPCGFVALGLFNLWTRNSFWH